MSEILNNTLADPHTEGLCCICSRPSVNVITIANKTLRTCNACAHVDPMIALLFQRLSLLLEGLDYLLASTQIQAAELAILNKETNRISHQTNAISHALKTNEVTL